jgi:leucyl aminopeptidase
VEINAVSEDILKLDAGAVIVTLYEGEKTLQPDTAAADKKLGGAIAEMIKRGDIKGKLNEITLIHTLGRLPAERIVVLGLGKKKELTLNKVRAAMGDVCRSLRGKHVTTIASVVLGEGANDIKAADAAQAMAEGALLGLYTFRQYMTKKEDAPGTIKKLTIVGAYNKIISNAIETGKIIAEAVAWARDMINEPSNHLTPTDMAAEAKKMAKQYGLDFQVFDKDWMEEMEMGGLLGVARGSNEPPKFIIVNYTGRSSKDVDAALVGKGITFDSGGISIKPSENMGDMKGDMAGGASVLAAIRAIAQLKPKLNVIAIVPATENMPSGTAQKPGDIIKTMNGKTVEVINTDAEGRLILADALAYAVKIGAKNIIDVATLTGACQVALGNITSGLFSNDSGLQEKVLAAGKEAGEPAWAMPMDAGYAELIKSDVADIKNTGGRFGGAITGGKFLEEFVDKTPWVHMDIAGTSDTDKDKGYQCKGATGVPVRTLVNYVLKQAKK